MSSNQKQASWWIIVAFIIVPIIVSIVSTIHCISFFQLSNYPALSLTLALAFEIGALSSLAGLVAMDKINKGTVWLIFILLTIFQMMGNTYYSYDTTSFKMLTNSNLIKNFTELFGFSMEDASDIIFIKRIIAILSGAILPVISLSFLHLLVTYISKTETKEIPAPEETPEKKTEVANDIVVVESQIEPEVQQQTIVPVTAPIAETKKDPKSFLRYVQTTNLVDSAKEEVKIKTEPISATTQSGFDEFLEKKIKKLEEDKISYGELLDTLFRGGGVKKGETLKSFGEFIKDLNSDKFSPNIAKTFLSLLNYLDITNVSGEQKTALVSYEDAKKMLTDYLSLENV